MRAVSDSDAYLAGVGKEQSIFKTTGRIGRRDYFMLYLACIVFGVIIGYGILPRLDPAGWLLFLVPLIWVNTCIAVQRLHDIGRSGWWALLMLIPLVNVVLALYLLFAPGDPYDNEYGSGLLGVRASAEEGSAPAKAPVIEVQDAAPSAPVHDEGHLSPSAEDRLRRLLELRDKGLVSESAYEEKQAHILRDL